MELNALCQKGFEKRAALLYPKVVRGVWHTEDEVPEDLSIEFENSSFALAKSIFGPEDVTLDEAWKKLSKSPNYVLIGDPDPVADAITFDNCVAIVLGDIPLPLESELDWDQIREVRSDARHLQRIRDLRLWVSDLTADQDVSKASALINQRIEDYRDSLKAHGIRSALTAVTAILPGAAASAYLPLGAAGVPLALSAASIWVGRRVLSRNELKKSDRFRGIAVVDAINSDLDRAAKN